MLCTFALSLSFLLCKVGSQKNPDREALGQASPGTQGAWTGLLDAAPSPGPPAGHYHTQAAGFK